MTDSLPHLHHMKKGEKPMKKYISMLLAAVLCASLLAACGGSGKHEDQYSETLQALLSGME